MFGFKFDKTMEEVKSAVENKDIALLVDVREKDEYIEGHIPGALFLPLSELEELALKTLSNDKALYVYCRSGQRAKGACRILKQLGFQEVYNVGGVLQWPYETVSGERSW